MRRRTSYALLCFVCGCTIGGGKAVLPGGEGNPRDGVQGDGDGDPDGTPNDGDGNPRDGSITGDGDGDDTPRQDAGGDGDGTMSQPDAGGDGDGEPGPIPANCSPEAYGGHDYLFCTDSIWWDQARAVCQGAGYDLVVIEDTAENDFVKGHLMAESWIGLTDLDVEATFAWVVPGESATAGAAISLTNWIVTQPDDCVGLGDQDCVHIRPDGMWDDMACNETQGCPFVTGTRQFVCESY